MSEVASKKCNRCGGSVIRGRVIAANGAVQVKDLCQLCGRNAGGNGISIPHSQVPDLDSLPILGDYTQNNNPCQVRGCQGKGTEYHHWAPRFLFPDDSELWPGGYLCRRHHAEWHATVTPEMAKRVHR